jgi:DNA repair exonuclease SbcCD ATPase subunit
MKIKNIEWRNVASYGNKIQKLELPEKAGLIQVVGENGVGKSTISDVITFGLYGKLEGKKLKDIPNRSNKNSWMKISFEQDGKTYEVERGLEPSLFQLSIDGSIYDQAGKNNVQDYLSDDILKIPYYVFNNTISLSINDFKSFLKMSTADKKLIIDKIFGFYILNEMRDILKEESKSIKSSIDRLSGEIFATGRSITASQKELEELQQKIIENSGNEIEKNEDQLENYKSLLQLHTDRIKSFRTKENEVNKSVTTSYEKYSDLVSKMKELDTKINLYNQDKCPTCSSDLSTEFHKSIFDDLCKLKEKYQEDIKVLKSNYEDAKKAQNKITETKNDLFSKGSKIETGIKTLQNKIKDLKTAKNNDEANSIRKLLSQANEDLTVFNQEKSSFEEKQGWIKTLDEVLSEKGVKQLAIKSILPSLNNEILNTLLSLHLPYKVVFNEEFNAQIFHLGEEISPQTLSTGEMKKVDFAVLIAVIKLMKIRFSSVNILFLDEIFSSVDPDGVHSILTTLRKLSDDLNMNIFVINHAPMPTEIFDYKIEISKKNNFSDILFEKLS